MNRKQAEHDRTVLPRIQELKAEGRSLRGIAEQLQRDGVPTARRGGPVDAHRRRAHPGPCGADAARGGEPTAPAGRSSRPPN